MPLIVLRFNRPLNVSVQVNDVAYFSNPDQVGVAGNPQGGPWAGTTTPHLKNDQNEIIKIGTITNIQEVNNISLLTCDMPQNLFNQYFADLRPNSFIMFSKDNKANMANMLGYYASVEYRNNSTDKAELFATGVDVHESSK
tara:strand:+ start:1170 stop:1592 length:423 start_codon:yes stop_codon:yes gene_type:complete